MPLVQLLILVQLSGLTLSLSPSELPHHKCGPCLCSPSGQIVDCSSLNLTFIPSAHLPSNTKTLTLMNNSISSLPSGVFRRFSDLRQLDISHNEVKNISSASFSGLGNLLSLNLSFNSLSLIFRADSDDVSVPSPFSLLRSLQILDLSSNEIDSVPADVFHGLKSSLRWLDLSYNKLTMKFPSPRPEFPFNLTYLDLSHNALTFFGEEAFAGLTHLQWLNLSHNQIPLNNWAYPPGVFQPFASTLRELRLQGNCDSQIHHEILTYPDQALAKLFALELLHIDGLPNSANTYFGPGFLSMTSLSSLSLSKLDGGFCSLYQVKNNSFQNLPKSLLFLNISDCKIASIEADSFLPLRRLRVLHVSGNPDLGIAELGQAMYGLQGSDLRHLYANAIVHPYAVCVVVTQEDTKYFRNTSIETIYAEDNRMELFFKGALLNMPDSLRTVHLKGNRLGFGRYFKDLSKLQNLQEIYADGQHHAQIPPENYPAHDGQLCRFNAATASGSTDEVRSSLKFISAKSVIDAQNEESVERSSVAEGFVISLPVHLKKFVSRFNQLYYKLLHVEFNPNNSLRILDLSNNLLTTWRGPLTGVEKLESLHLANNVGWDMSADFFKTLTSLKLFNASRNYLFKTIDYDVEGKLFEPLVNLEVLDLGENLINNIPLNTFKGLKNLKWLCLSLNEMYSFEVNILHMFNLTTLDLSSNRIRFLPEFIMDHLDSVAQDHNVSVNLHFNPIACTCKHLSFLQWIQRSRIHFVQKSNLVCSRSDGGIKRGANIVDIVDDLERRCNGTKHEGILVGAVTCFFCLIVAVVSAILYRYRWKLRYLYYASRLAYRHHQNLQDNFRFDAFVSYALRDQAFVHGELLRELETRASLQLNIHSRDFTPGCPIPSNIVEAVQSSRRTLVVLSRALLESDWCHYEMQMANMEAAHTGRDVLLFLIYEKVASDQMSREVLYNLQTSTYIDYPAHDDHSLVRDFWDRLAQAIRQ